MSRSTGIPMSWVLAMSQTQRVALACRRSPTRVQHPFSGLPLSPKRKTSTHKPSSGHSRGGDGGDGGVSGARLRVSDLTMENIKRRKLTHAIILLEPIFLFQILSSD